MMKYNKEVEDCFFKAVYGGFSDLEYKPISSYASIDAKVQVVFAIDRNQGKAPSQGMRFKACGNPFIMAAAEWIVRRCVDENYTALHSMNVDKWMELFAISRIEIKTALQIDEFCVALLEAMNTIKSK